MFVQCNLAVLMAENNIRSISELERRTGLARLTLTRMYNDEAKVMSYQTALTLCNFFGCEIDELYSIVDADTKRQTKKLVAERRERIRDAFVYFAQDLNSSLIKIGKSMDVKSRLYQLELELKTNLQLIGVIKSKDAVALEKEIHFELNEHRVKGEWFDISTEYIKRYIDQRGT